MGRHEDGSDKTTRYLGKEGSDKKGKILNVISIKVDREDQIVKTKDSMILWICESFRCTHIKVRKTSLLLPRYIKTRRSL